MKNYDSDCTIILFELFYPYFIIIITVVITIKPHNPVKPTPIIPGIARRGMDVIMTGQPTSVRTWGRGGVGMLQPPQSGRG